MTVRLRLVVAALAAVAVVAAGGCRDRTKIHVVGSTSVAPFVEVLGQEYEKAHPDILVEVQAGGSTVGVQQARNGLADIGTCSRLLTEEEAKDLTAITIARDGVAVVVNRDNPVDELTLEQVRKLFSGQIANWNQVGGRDAGVTLVIREAASGTREAFEHLVMQGARVNPKRLEQDSNGSIHQTVKGDVNAVGYMSLGLVHGEVKALRIDGVEPTREAVLDGRYKLVRPFLFLVKGQPKPAVQEFIDFVLSPDGQKLLEKEGLVRPQ